MSSLGDLLCVRRKGVGMFVLVGVLLMLCDVAKAQNTNSSDVAALMALYQSTNGPSWIRNHGWGSNTDPCLNSWFGVHCVAFDNQSTVVALTLTSNGLSGTLPSELVYLTNLENLQMNGNKLSGSIPDELALLPYLVYVDLSNNTLTGSISPQFAARPFSNLLLHINQLSGTVPQQFNTSILNLANNQFSGEIAPNLFCGACTAINLSNNNFSGFLPEIEPNDSLEEVSLSNNNLTGSLPVSLFETMTLSSLFIDNNQFTGSLPNITRDFVFFETFSATNNRLEGIIPDAYWSMQEKLDLSSNQLSGNIFEDLTRNFTALKEVVLDNNLFTGTLSEAFYAAFSGIKSLSLRNNRFTGVLSQNISKLAGITNLDLSNNQFEGEIPAAIGDVNGNNNCMGSNTLRTLDLSNNAFSGEIPSSIGQLNSLQYLNLSHNLLDGAIPDELSCLPMLEYMDLSFNLLNGTIPATFAKNPSQGTDYLSCTPSLASLIVLRLNNNQLSGLLPGELSGLHVSTLELQYNQLGGGLPEQSFSGTLLHVNLSHNYFSGNLTQFVYGTPSLRIIDLSYNNFTGTISSELGATNLQYIDFSNNQMTGIIPNSLGNFTYLNLANNEFYGYIPLVIKSIWLNGGVLDLVGNDFFCPVPIWASTFASCSDKHWAIYFDINLALFVLIICASIFFAALHFRYIKTNTGWLPQTRQTFAFRHRMSSSVIISSVVEIAAGVVMLFAGVFLNGSTEILYTRLVLVSLLVLGITVIILGIVSIFSAYYYYFYPLIVVTFLRYPVLLVLLLWERPYTFASNRSFDTVAKVILPLIVVVVAFSLINSIRLLFSIFQAKKEEEYKLSLHVNDRKSTFDSIRRRDWYIRTEDIIVKKTIGSGAFGDVMLAEWRAGLVVVKQLRNNLIDDAAYDDFIKEMNIMSNLEHKNIIRFIGATLEDAFPRLIMEFMPGGALYGYLHDPDKPLTWLLRLKFASDIACGMEYLHANNLIHRDLKSPNVLLDNELTAKISDFGISRSLGDNMTRSAGTSLWAAPEVFDWKGEYNFSADVYSFGIVLYELTTRENPYGKLQQSRGWHNAELLTKIVHEGLRPVIPPPTADAPVPDAWKSLAERCWDADPNARPTFTEVRQLLVLIEASVGEIEKSEKPNVHKFRSSSSSGLDFRIDINSDDPNSETIPLLRRKANPPNTS